MRQNRNITIAYDVLEEREKLTIDCLESIAKTSGWSVSQVAKYLVELGLAKCAEDLKRKLGIEIK